MHCNDNPQAIEVADRKREQGDQGAGGPPRDATEDSVMLPTARLPLKYQVPSRWTKYHINRRLQLPRPGLGERDSQRKDKGGAGGGHRQNA